MPGAEVANACWDSQGAWLPMHAPFIQGITVKAPDKVLPTLSLMACVALVTATRGPRQVSSSALMVAW